MAELRRPRIATLSLAGCFGCHMSLLDMDEAILDVLSLVELDSSPLNDIKQPGSCDLGIIEGGVCSSENIERLRLFRSRCKHLVAVGACAVNGGIPAMRNAIPLEQCLTTVYLEAPVTLDAQIPSDPELPLMLDKVYPVHEVVRIDYFLPGCPPPAEVIREFLLNYLRGRPTEVAPGQVHYD